MSAATLAEVTDRLGSAAEARWILEQAGEQWPELVDRRLAGEPLQYVLGSWPFRHLDLLVDRRVLIPRPETEQVVEVALAELGRLRPAGAGDPGAGSAAGPICVDLGTGSGAIALSLAAEGRARSPGLEIWATDASAQALAVAAENLARTVSVGPLAPVFLAEGDWFGALPADLVGRVDLLVANPPYVAEADIADLDPEVRDWEPIEALAAGPGAGGVPGMAEIEAIVGAAPDWLGPDGVMVVELDPSQAVAALAAARSAGMRRARVERDLARRDRMLVAGR